MQKIITKNTTINFLLFLLIVAIPFYQMRISIFISSISLLSLTEIILSTFSFFAYKKYFKTTYLNNKYFCNLILLLLLTFSISVFKTNTLHAYGIFTEWFVLPILTSFIIFIHLQKSKENILILKKFLTFIFSIIILISIYYWFKKDLTYDFRLKAFYLSPNHLAMFISSLIFIVFNLFHQVKGKFKKIFLFTLIFLGIVVLFKTNSLINLLAVFVGINIYLIYFYRKSFFILTSIILTIAVILISFQQKIPNIETVLQKNSGSSRLVIYNVSANLIRGNLSLGNNVGEFQNNYLLDQRFYPPYPEWAVPTPHNFILMNLFSGGLIFTTLFILIILYWTFNILLKIKKSNNIDAFFYFLIIVVIMIQGIFDTPYWKNDLSLIFWLVIILGLNNLQKIKIVNLATKN